MIKERETIQIGEDLTRNIIWEQTNKNYSLIMDRITDTDNDSYDKEYIVRRNADGKYFKFDLRHCEHLDIAHKNLNTFPLSAIEVRLKTITSIVFE